MIYNFSSFKLDTDHQELMSQGRPVSIPPKALSVLIYLIENRDRMVPKSELLDQFWTLQVSEAALQTTISLVRKAVDDQGRSNRCIKTFHGRGFRFVAALEANDADAGPDATRNPEKTAHHLQEQRWFAVLTVRLEGAGEGSGSSRGNSFLETAERLVSAGRGRLLHLMFDGFSASFGVDPHLEDGTRLALTCAYQIANLKEFRDPSGIGALVSVGVDCGAGTYAGNNKEPVWRLPSRVARGSADLAALAVGGEILVSKALKDLLRDEIETEPTKGGFRLLAPPEERAGLPARPLKRPTKFVGRRVELSFLHATLDKSFSETRQAALILGPAGIGKSRLVSEFLADLDQDGVSSHRYFCLPRLNETPLSLIHSMCVDLMQISPLAEITDPVDAALVSALLDGAARLDPILDGMSDKQKQQRSYALLYQLLKRVCRGHHRILVFEDIHWIDTTSRRFLEVLIREAHDLNLMIVLTTRPTDKLPLVENVLQLAPLEHAESLALLQGIPELAQIDATVVETLVQRAAGNPFFLEELALATQTGADPVRDLPDTVQAVIEVRIGALEGSMRMMIYVMAVVGQVATPALVAHLLNHDESGTQTHLDRLVSMGFLQETEEGYAFRHMLLQDTAYAMLVAEDRKSLHHKIATYLEDQVDPVRPETLAWHFQEAGEEQSAIGYWIKASYTAQVRSAQQEAAVFANHGLALLKAADEAVPDQEISLYLSLAQSLMAMKGYGAKSVGDAFRRVLVLSQKSKNHKALANSSVGLWVHTWVCGQLDEALRHANNLLGMANSSGNPTLLVQGHAGIGEVLTHMAEFDEAMSHLEQAIAVVGEGFPDTITAQNATVTCAAYAAWVSGIQGRFSDMQMYYEQSKDLTGLFDNRFAKAIHLALCSEAFMFVGDVEACRDLAGQAVVLSRENGFPFWLGTGLVMQGWALAQDGQMEIGLNKLEKGISIFERTGAHIQIPNWYGLKAETLMRAGRLEDASSSVDYALSIARQTGDIWFIPRILSIQAQILRAENKTAQADGLMAEVARIAAEKSIAQAFYTVPPPH